MKIHFYQFNKRLTSSEQPDETQIEYLEYDCVIKSKTSFLNPVLLVDTNGVLPLANYLSLWLENEEDDTLLGYYFVDDIHVGNAKIFEIVCSIDALATCRSEILNTSAYIVYATKNFNRWIKDDRVPILPDCVSSASTATIKEHQSGNPVFSSTHQDNVVILSAVNKLYGLTHYVLHESELVDVMNAISNAGSTVWSDLSQQFGSAIQSIVQIIRLPINDDVLPTESNNKLLQLGNYQVVPTDPSIPAYEFPVLAYTYINADCTVGIPAGYTDFRLCEPYQQLKVALPFVGTIDVNITDYRETGNIQYRIAIDLLTGSICYENILNSGVNHVIASYSGQCGTFIPFVSNQIANASNIVQQTAGGLTALGLSVISQNPAPAVIGGIGAIAGAFYSSNQKVTSVIGSYSGNRSDVLTYSIKCTLIKYDTAIEPSNLTEYEGRPVCKVDALTSYVGGFVKTNKFELAGTYFKELKDKVNQLLDSGIYLI